MTHDDTLRTDQGDYQVIAGTTADKVDAHTPDPQTPPVVEHVADPPRPDHEGLSQLQETVTGLATAVATLTETVTNLVTGKGKDESPAPRPWTHRGSPAKDGE